MDQIVVIQRIDQNLPCSVVTGSPPYPDSSASTREHLCAVRAGKRSVGNCAGNGVHDNGSGASKGIGPGRFGTSAKALQAGVPIAMCIASIGQDRPIPAGMAQPGVVVVSDGTAIVDEKLEYYPWDSPYEGKSVHPRSAGTRAKVLRMVREDTNMSLMEAISKMSYLHAKYFDELGGISQFRTKGRVQVGADADIVVGPFRAHGQHSVRSHRWLTRGLPGSW